MNLLRMAAFAGALLLSAAAVFAADATIVTVPVGSWLASAAPAILEIALAAVPVLVAYGFRHLPPALVGLLQTMQAEQLLSRAVSYGINAVAGAEAGKTLSVNTGNAVVAQAVQYAGDHGPALLLGYLGGTDAIAQKIIARLPLEAASAASTSLGATVLVSAPAPPAQPVPAAG